MAIVLSLVVAVAALLSPAVVVAAQQGIATSPTYAGVRVDWQAQPGKKGGTVVHGYVHNGRSYPIDSVRLQVESLGPSGQVLAKGVEHVRPSMGPGGRTYFEVPLRAAGADYRVSILFVDFVFPGDDRRRRTW